MDEAVSTTYITYDLYAPREANEITAVVKEEEKLRFEVELVWDIHRAGTTDIVVIRLMKANEDEEEPEGNEGYVAVTYWTLLKFKAVEGVFIN